VLEYPFLVEIRCINEEEFRFLTRIAPELFFVPAPVLLMRVPGEDFLILLLLTELLEDFELEVVEPLERSFLTLRLPPISPVPDVLDSFLVPDIAEAEGA